jgi:endonuclease-3
MSISTAAFEHLTRIYDLLVDAYGQPAWKPDYDPLGGLIGTILSQHTSDINSERAYKQLITTFPTWEQVCNAPTQEVAEAIKSGGLANVKAPRIQHAVYTIATWQQQKGDSKELSEFLREELTRLPLEDAWKYLQAIPGVGPKTAACVLLFNLGRPLMPIDTHLHRLTRRLGLIGPNVNANQAHTIFLKILPSAWAYPLHVNLIRHGRTICHAQRPKCTQCPLFMECVYAGNAQLQETVITV